MSNLSVRRVRVLKTGITLGFLIGVGLALFLKYPQSLWKEVAPVTTFILLILVGVGLITEWLITARRMASAWVAIALRGLSWWLLVGLAIYLQLKIGQKELLVFLLGGGILLVMWYRIKEIPCSLNSKRQ